MCLLWEIPQSFPRIVLAEMLNTYLLRFLTMFLDRISSPEAAADRMSRSVNLNWHSVASTRTYRKPANDWRVAVV